MSIEKIFSMFHPEYYGNTFNANLVPETFSEDLRVTIAQTLGIIAQNHIDLVTEFIGTVFKCKEKNISGVLS